MTASKDRSRTSHFAPDRAAEPPERGVGWLTLPTLFVGIVASGSSLAIFGSLLSMINIDLDLSPTQSGATQAVFFVGFLTGALVTGRLMGSVPSRRVWLLSLSSVLLGALLASVPNYAVLMVGRFVAGFGFSSMVLFATAVLVTRFPRRAAVMLNILHATIAGSAAVTMLVTPSVALALDSWSAVLWIATVGTAVPLLVAATAARPPIVRADTAAGFGVLLRNASHPALLTLYPVILVYVGVEQSITVFLPQFMEQRFAVSESYAVTLAAMLWTGIILGRLGSAAIGSRVDPVVQLIIGGVGLGVGMTGVMITENIYITPWIVLASGLLGGPMIPLAIGLATQRMPDKRNTAITLCQIASCFGGVLGPLMTGAVGDSDSLFVALTLGFLTAAIAVMPLVRALPAAERNATKVAPSAGS